MLRNRSWRVPNAWPVAFLLVFGFCLTACVSPRGEEARELLLDITAGGGTSRLKETTPEPSRLTIGYRRTAGPATADLYQGLAPPQGGVVVVPGLTPDGKDDPRLVAFAKSLARARFLVLVPDIPNTRALKVSAADSVFISDAIEELAQRSAAGAERRVGLVAISYAVGPALLAASRPRPVAMSGSSSRSAAITISRRRSPLSPPGITARRTDPGSMRRRTSGASGSSCAATPVG
jgi:hypothetical protein